MPIKPMSYTIDNIKQWPAHEAPYLCLKYAGGRVARISTKGRSTTTNSSLARKSQHAIGRYCMISFSSLQDRSSSPPPAAAAVPFIASLLLFLPVLQTLMSSAALYNQVAPQNRINRVFVDSEWEEGAGSNATPSIGSWAFVNRLGRLEISSLPQEGNWRVSTSYIWITLSGKASKRVEGCIGSKARACADRWKEGNVQWCYKYRVRIK